MLLSIYTYNYDRPLIHLVFLLLIIKDLSLFLGTTVQLIFDLMHLLVQLTLCYLFCHLSYSLSLFLLFLSYDIPLLYLVIFFYRITLNH